MPRDFHKRAEIALALGALLGLFLLAGCGPARRAPVTLEWLVGRPSPRFDPQGPADPVRAAIEGLLSRGLMEEDSSGRIVLGAADSVRISPDGLVYTFHLPRLTFAEGGRCRSQDFRNAIERGIGRLDHGTQAWLLGSIVGMEKLRVGRTAPPLGIATPDEQTLVLALSRPDSLLLRKLALPGIATPWASAGAGEWRDGIGPYKLAARSATALVLTRRTASSGAPDTIRIQFAPSGARVLSELRMGEPDLVWPLPAGLVRQPLPAGYRVRAAEARPERRLLLVLRADLAPTARAAARHALAHGLNRADIVSALGSSGGEVVGWLTGADAFDLPGHDPIEVREWLERGKLGRSLHVVMAYARFGATAEVARAMQVEWARLGLDVELRPLDPERFAAAALQPGGAQALLVEDQAPLEDPRTELACLVVPLRGPALGVFRSGWRTREFDRWIDPRAAAPLDVAFAQQRLAEEHIVLPLARLPWVWVERASRPAGFHPRFGPRIAGFR